MKVYFNQVGVVSNVDYQDHTFRQGDVGIDLLVDFAGISNIANTATLNLTRSDGSNITNVSMLIDTTCSRCFKYKFNDEWFFAKAGETTLTIFLHAANGDIVASGQVLINVESTDYSDDPETITEEQYNSLIARVAGLAENIDTMLCVDSISSLGDLDDFEVGQIVQVKNQSTHKLYQIIAGDNGNVADEIFNFADVGTIKSKIPSAATSTNKLTDEAKVREIAKEFSAYYITKDRAGNAFETYAELQAAELSGEFYSGGTTKTPDRNDYCVVLEDEEHNGETTRYIYDVGTVQSKFVYQYTVSKAGFTQEQQNAIDSGITSGIVNILKLGQIPSIEVEYNMRLDTFAETYGNYLPLFKMKCQPTKYIDNDFFSFERFYNDQRQVYVYRFYRWDRNFKEIYENSGVDATTLNDVFGLTRGASDGAAIRTYYETTDNKITSWGEPTNTQYPSAKLVKDSLEEIREVATGRTKNFSLSYEWDEAYLEDTIFDYGTDQDYVVKYWNNNQWETMSYSQWLEWSENKQVENNIFNSQEVIDLETGLANNGYLIVSASNDVFYLLQRNERSKLFDLGSNVYVKENNVPDRWYEGHSQLLSLEVKDLTKKNNFWTGTNNFRDTATFEDDAYFVNDEIKNGSGDTLKIRKTIDSVGTTIKDTTHTTYSGGLNCANQYIFTQALTSLSISALEYLSSESYKVWNINFKVGSGFTFSMPSNKTYKFAEGEPIWDTNTTYTLLIQEGIDTDYIIYVARA